MVVEGGADVAVVCVGAMLVAAPVDPSSVIVEESIWSTLEVGCTLVGGLDSIVGLLVAAATVIVQGVVLAASLISRDLLAVLAAVGLTVVTVELAAGLQVVLLGVDSIEVI